MMPAINTLKVLPESFSLTEDNLVLQCAHEMMQNLDTQIQESRNLMEISNLKTHKEVVNSIIEKFSRGHLKVSLSS